MRFKLSYEYATYLDYCAERATYGYQVMPESLWNTLKQEFGQKKV
jgi:hypothetical protein